MKKVGLLLILSFMAFTTVSAQSEAYTSVEAGRKTTFQQNGFGDNWFIGLGAKGFVYVGDNDQHADSRQTAPFAPYRGHPQT